ncbi:MAG: hypothetical protein M3O46_09800 [Myxococcota bacterium]|nr:hypothetical protein [Myxococcota bacterium]
MSDLTKRERELLWGRALGDATKYALYLTRNRTRAEELAAEAVAACLDPTRMPWDPDRGQTPSQRAVYVVRMLLKDEAAKKRVRDDHANARAADDGMRRTVPRPDARLSAQERLARGEGRKRKIRASLAPFEQQVFDLFGEGLTAAEQARRLGVEVSKIYEARRHIAEQIRGLPDEEIDESDDAADAYLRDGQAEDREDEVAP